MEKAVTRSVIMTSPTTPCGKSRMGLLSLGRDLSAGILKQSCSLVQNHRHTSGPAVLPPHGRILHNAPNTTATPLNNAQPWRFFVSAYLALPTLTVRFTPAHNSPTTNPSQDDNNAPCLGRKNRLLGGFFISGPRVRPDAR